jgi:hypothetical protein
MTSGHSALWHAIKMNQTGVRKLLERAIQHSDAATGNVSLFLISSHI